MGNLSNETFICLGDVMRRANFNVDYSILVGAIIEICKESENVYTSILERKKDTSNYIPLFFSKKLPESGLICSIIQEIREALALSPYIRKDEQLLGLGHCWHVLYPVYVKEALQLLFIFSFQTEEEAVRAKQGSLLSMADIIPLLQEGYKIESMKQEGKHRDILMQVTKQFNSTMDVSKLLGGIVGAVKEAFPSYDVQLLLSQEWEVEDGIPIKPLQYGSDNKETKAQHAYLTGVIQLERLDDEMLLYAPLRGKQGVYGVMEIRSNVPIQEQVIEFIQLLADTGGSALENAELYQRSTQLIHDLKLINETAHQLNSNLKLGDSINFMAKQIKDSFGAEEVGFIMYDSNGELRVLEGSTLLFERDYFFGEMESFIKKVKKEKDPIYIGDSCSSEMIDLPDFRSVLTVPMVQNSELKGLVVALHSSAYHFTFDNFKLLQSLIQHSTLAFTNAMLHEKLERLVITDHLTRLHSRNYLDERVQESMNTDVDGTFILLDIDNFKSVNDQFGHQVGDDIIIQVANIMKKNTREEDIAARWGGEELAIYFPNLKYTIGCKIAQRIVRAVARETSPRVTVSIGVAYWNAYHGETSLTKLFNLADEALYQAKANGKNCVMFNQQ